MKHIYVCNTCGNSSVLRDAWAAWDFETQDWVLREVFPEAYCQICDGPTKTHSFRIVDQETV